MTSISGTTTTMKTKPIVSSSDTIHVISSTTTDTPPEMVEQGRNSNQSSMIGFLPKRHNDHDSNIINNNNNTNPTNDTIVGTRETIEKWQNEVRGERHQVAYEPSDYWWKPPLTSWIPENNLGILIVLCLYNAMVPILAYYTNFCGQSSDINNHIFCSDDYILLQDKAITGFAVGMFLLLAFRTRQAYDRWL